MISCSPIIKYGKSITMQSPCVQPTLLHHQCTACVESGFFECHCAFHRVGIFPRTKGEVYIQDQKLRESTVAQGESVHKSRLRVEIRISEEGSSTESWDNSAYRGELKVFALQFHHSNSQKADFQRIERDLLTYLQRRSPRFDCPMTFSIGDTCI